MPSSSTNTSSQADPLSPEQMEQVDNLVDWSGRIRRLFVVVIGTIISGMIGQRYGIVNYGVLVGDEFRGFRTGASIGLITILIETYYIRSQRNTWIRRVAFLPGLFVRIVVLTLIIRACLIGNELISDFLTDKPLLLDFEFDAELRDTLFSVILVVGFVIVSQLTTLIGVTRFFNLVVGRYFRPVREERIFMFIDLVGSSKLARTLGDVEFHEFLSDFFHLIDRPIAMGGGEIVSYVGDGAIVTWPLRKKPKRNARCLRVLHHIDLLVSRRGHEFQTRYGSTPSFRVAVHGGPVVVGECGNMRRQVTFLGDVVNMTSRMEELAKQEEERILISDDLLTKMELPDEIQTTHLGGYTVKGVDSKLSLSRVSFTPKKKRNKINQSIKKPK